MIRPRSPKGLGGAAERTKDGIAIGLEILSVTSADFWFWWSMICIISSAIPARRSSTWFSPLPQMGLLSTGQVLICRSQLICFQAQGLAMTGKIVSSPFSAWASSIGISLSIINLELRKLAVTSRIATLAWAMMSSMACSQSTPTPIWSSLRALIKPSRCKPPKWTSRASFSLSSSRL